MGNWHTVICDLVCDCELKSGTFKLSGARHVLEVGRAYMCAKCDFLNNYIQFKETGPNDVFCCFFFNSV